jgi:hypothetical protein
MKVIRFALIGLIAATASIARGQATTQPDQPANLLDPKFSSKMYGLEFCPPANSTEIQVSAPDEIVEFDRDDYNWQLKAWRVRLDKSLPLTAYNDQFGTPQEGMLDATVRKLQGEVPNAQILRNEVINVGRVRVGMIALRYETPNRGRRLTEQAIFEAPDADHRIYYIMDLTGPGKPDSEPEDLVNPAEKMAADTFAQVVDSTVLLDRAQIANDQVQRLYQTRALFVIWDSDNSEIIRNGLVPEQFQRILKDGKDIGFNYVVETLDNKGSSPQSGSIHIGVRSRELTDQNLQWDVLTWMNCSMDRKHENWTMSARCTNLKGDVVDSISQLGDSDEETKAIALRPKIGPDGSLTPDDQNGPLGQGNVDVATVRSLEVNTSFGPVQLDPFKQDVPAFYIPKAISYLLPQIVPVDRPHTYMMAEFIPTSADSRGGGGGQVMARYVDVLPIQETSFNGQRIQAVQIVDRIGLQGAATNHYFASDGKYIGSVGTAITPDGKRATLTILPTDSDTLQHLWNEPDLTVPHQLPPLHANSPHP